MTSSLISPGAGPNEPLPAPSSSAGETEASDQTIQAFSQATRLIEEVIENATTDLGPKVENVNSKLYQTRLLIWNLSQAVRDSDISKLRALIEENSSSDVEFFLNSRDGAGNTPLYYAVDNNNVDIVNELLEYNPNKESINEAFIRAVENGLNIMQLQKD